jgi:hypothetical protein
VWGQEITTKLFHDLLQLVHTHWGFTARKISHLTLETPSCTLWIQRVTPLIHHPSCSGWFQCISSRPCTTVWHIQNWSLPLTRSGHAHTWLVVAHVHPGWFLQEPVLNMIWVTYQTRRLSVTPSTVFKPVTQILTPCCYKKIIHLPLCTIGQISQIKTTDQPNSQSNDNHDLPRDTSRI